MNVLEKILEEILQYRKDNSVLAGKQVMAIEEIIRSHMDEAKNTNVPSNDDMEEKIREHIAECLHRIDNIRSFIGSKEYTNNDEKCIRNIEVLKTIITALEGYLSSKKKSGNDGWISVEERLPEKPVFGEDSYIVQHKCIITPYSAYWDGENWTEDYSDEPIRGIIAWQPLPERYKGGDDRA